MRCFPLSSQGSFPGIYWLIMQAMALLFLNLYSIYNFLLHCILYIFIFIVLYSYYYYIYCTYCLYNNIYFFVLYLPLRNLIISLQLVNFLISLCNFFNAKNGVVLHFESLIGKLSPNYFWKFHLGLFTIELKHSYVLIWHVTKYEFFITFFIFI